jgi:hypothetical protein
MTWVLKAFILGDESDIEGMTQTLTMIRESEGALPDMAGRIKNITFHFEK